MRFWVIRLLVSDRKFLGWTNILRIFVHKYYKLQLIITQHCYLCTDGQWLHPLVVIVTLTNNAASCTYSWTTLTSRWCNFTSEGRSRRLLISRSCLNKRPTIVWTRSFSSPSFSLERSFAASHILRCIPINDRSDRISGSWKSKSVYKTSMSVFYRP